MMLRTGGLRVFMQSTQGFSLLAANFEGNLGRRDRRGARTEIVLQTRRGYFVDFAFASAGARSTEIPTASV